MVDNYQRNIDDLKERLDRAKDLKIRNETKLEQLQKQKEEIIKELQDMGIKPEELESEIKRLKKEIEELITQANEVLPLDAIKFVDS